MELEWIPIKDGLPPKDLEVLATNEEDEWVVMAILKTKCWYNSWDYINNEKCPIYPTHWMYKPEPPKKQ